ncbi:MAG TPA: aminotransferase class I/II-fold pyridoxal phosphate-dependent enzyme [Gemmatimonadaceae bacterium]|nr:aminotransferase class I/II-fold pyridoxal phosphate-dependent enzyme [Gemmatimonadaceae bacterium]
MRLETLCIHAGYTPDPATGAISPPIHLSTTFERGADGEYPHGYRYARESNPNRRALEEGMAALEGGADALAFASGQAASAALFQALQPGDHVVLPLSVYYGTARLAESLFADWGLQITRVDTTDLAAVAAALTRPTRLVWIETPSNPLLAVTDIAAVVQLARRAGAMVVVDNTWATPLGQRPLELGADFAMHASTKYLGGHSDVMGGLLVAREKNDFVEKLRSVQQTGGSGAPAFDSWLVLRGIRTLACRFEAQCRSAMEVARFLARHPAVVAVHYPGLESHPGHTTAARQMRLWGAMLSFQVKGGRSEAMSVAARVRIFRRATSLGGVESLIEHRASIEGAGSRTPDNLLRLSVGLEHPDDLVEDLARALQ